jgi:hypothetical protein
VTGIVRRDVKPDNTTPAPTMLEELAGPLLGHLAPEPQATKRNELEPIEEDEDE